MDRSRRITQPKPSNGQYSNRSNHDPFLNQPTMSRSPNANHNRINVNNTAIDNNEILGGSRGGQFSRSQDK